MLAPNGSLPFKSSISVWDHANWVSLFLLGLKHKRKSRFCISPMLAFLPLYPTGFGIFLLIYFALNASFNYLQGQLPNRLKFPVIKYIDFSSNLLQGSVPLSLRISFLNLANNRFSGPIPSNIGDVLPNLTILYLSSNQITGKIPVSIGKLQNLRILDLSRNNLTGSIPSSLGNIYSLYALDLRHNNLSGAIPWTLGQLTELIILHLSDNRLSGELPPSLQNCSSLESIDLGNNKISGNIPPWIGEQWFARGLRILRLRSNALSGRLPSQLSNLSSLQILDIAENNLVGSIPASIGNLEAMAHVQNDSTYLISTWWYGDLSSQRLYVLPLKQRGPFYYEGSFCYKESLVVPFKNQGREFTKTLFLVTCIDLSRNNLSGEFPAAIMNLSSLVILNLSGNHISGHIPEQIAGLHQLESLDVSNNQLSGTIPSNMSSMASLTCLNFSNNNLSGIIPFSVQMTTFDETSYFGNPGLCGTPLLRKCQSQGSDRRGIVEENRGNESKDEWFFLSVGLGFTAGLLVPFIILATRRSWSDAASTLWKNL